MQHIIVNTKIYRYHACGHVNHHGDGGDDHGDDVRVRGRGRGYGHDLLLLILHH